MTLNVVGKHRILLMLIGILCLSEIIVLSESHYASNIILGTLNFLTVFLIFVHCTILKKNAVQVQNQMNNLMAHSNMGIYIKDLEGRFLEVNPAFERLFGLKTCHDLLHASQTAILSQQEQQVISKNQSITFEENLSYKGQQLTLMRTIYPLYNRKNEIIGIGAILVDVTDRKQIELELKKINEELESKVRDRTEKLMLSEQKYREIFENIQDVFFKTNLKGCITEISPSITQHSGFDRKELIGKSARCLFLKDNIRRIFLSRVKRQGQAEDFELQLKTKKNSAVYCSVNAHLCKDESGKIIGIEGTLHDITDKKKAEETALKLSMAITQSPATVMITDCKGNIEYVNPYFSEVTGYKSEEVIGQNPRILKAEAHPESFYKSLWDTITKGETWRGEFCNRKKNGELFWESASISPIRNSHGQITSFVAVKSDITESKHKEADILKLSQAIEQSSSCFLIANRWGHIEYVNRFFSEYTGYTQNEVIGQSLECLYPQNHRDTLYQNIWEEVFLLDAWHGDLPISGKSGKILWGNGSAAPVVNTKGELTHVILVFQDISERKRIEEELFHERSLLKNLMDNIPDAIYFKDQESRFLRINQSFANYLNLDSPEKAIGKTDLDLFDIRHGQQSYNDEREIVRTGKPLIGKVEEDILPNGERRWVSSTKVPVKNSVNEIVGIVGISRDISEVKNIEDQLKRQNVRLREAKLKAEESTRMKSEFLANMSHEIRTPMNAILGFSEILNRTITDPALKQHVEAIASSGKTLLQLINDILDLSKIEAGKLELHYSALNLNHLFSEMKQIFAYKVQEKDIEFKLCIDKNLPDAMLLDEVRIRQILLNLIGNAVKFTDSGYVEVSVRQVDVQHEKSRLSLCFEVKDTGIGIPADQQNLIFEDFKQMHGQDHSKYMGTGLGLAITKRLVELMGGKIELHSAPGEGSTFQVLLKDVTISSIHDTRDLEVIQSDEIAFKGGSVLIVDDVKYNRTLIQTFLEPINLTVIHAENGADAIEKARKHRPDIILMDIKMPVMDGYEATCLIKNDPDLKKIPVIMLTASAMQRDEKRVQDIGAEGYLRKPISNLGLIKELARFLDHTTQSTVSDENIVESPQIKEDLDKDETLDAEVLKKAIELIERDQLPIWEEIRDSVVLTEIESFAGSVYNVGQSLDVKALKHWGKNLMQKVAQFEMDSIPETVSRFPDVLANLKLRLDKEVTHAGYNS